MILSTCVKMQFTFTTVSNITKNCSVCKNSYENEIAGQIAIRDLLDYVVQALSMRHGEEMGVL